MKALIDEMHGQPFALATVISRNGSAPRSVGAKMLVRADGSSVGTVGGGALEAQVQQLAVQMIGERRALVQSFAFSGREAASMDAICGGQVEVLVEWLDPADGQTAAVIAGLQAAVEQQHKAWLETSDGKRYPTIQGLAYRLLRQYGAVYLVQRDRSVEMLYQLGVGLLRMGLHRRGKYFLRQVGLH